MESNDAINAWLEQLKADTIESLRAQYADTSAIGDGVDQAPQDKLDAPVSQSLNIQGQAPVSVYLGESGNGLVNDAARLLAARQNRINTDDSIIYSAEPHGDPSLPNQWAMVGRKFAAPPIDDSADTQTRAPYTDEEAAQDLARESRRAPPDAAGPLTDQYDLSDKSNFKAFHNAIVHKNHLHFGMN